MAKDIQVTSLANIPRRFRCPLRVKNIGRVRVEGDRYRGSHHGNIEFCFRLKCSEEVAVDQVGETVYRTRFPHVFIKQPGRLHRYGYDAVRESFFIIYPGEARRTLLDLGFPLERMAVEFRLTDGIREMMGRILDLVQQCEVSGVADEIDFLSLAFLAMVFNSRGDARDGRTPPAELARIQAVSSYLRLHCCESPDLGRTAARFGLSRRNFYRLWRKCFRTTPGRYLAQLRMAEACRLLEDDSLSVKEIAARLCYPDSAYFIAVFRRHAGTTPLAYRRRFLAEPPAEAPPG